MRAAVASLSAPDLRGGARFLWLGSALVVLLMLYETPRQSAVMLVVPIVGIGVILAVRSLAWPLGVISGATLISLLAAGNLPKGGTVAAYTAWLVFGLLVTMIRRDRMHPPLRLVLDFSAAGTIALAVLMLARLPASGDYAYGLSKVELFLLVGVVPYVVGIVVGYVRGDMELFFRVYVFMAVAAAVYNTFLIATGAANKQFSARYSIGATVDVIGLGRTMGEIA
ncbi:MAG: hypothetical protein QOK36_2172, partial [Gaiellales bacterium]|nr:hypothetical protein [Gaiellales bacterium]